MKSLDRIRSYINNLTIPSNISHYCNLLIFQIEEIASANPVAVEAKELIEKLELTQAQLDRWQLLRRQESYEDVTIPGTDAEIKLRFMRDSLFHYLTSSSGNSEDHLKALVKVADFSNVQMDKVLKVISKKRKLIY